MPARHAKGYVRVYLGRGHPYADTSGTQHLHRWLMMRHLGRILDTYEHVHHVNGNKETTRIADLEILEDVDHGLFHYGRRLGCGREALTYSPAGSELEDLDAGAEPWRRLR